MVGLILQVSKTQNNSGLNKMGISFSWRSLGKQSRSRMGRHRKEAHVPSVLAQLPVVLTSWFQIAAPELQVAGEKKGQRRKSKGLLAFPLPSHWPTLII